MGRIVSDEARHVSVMVTEVLDALGDVSHGVVVDGTVGQGGHAAAILGRTPSAVRLFGFDRDPAAIEVATRRLAPFCDRAVLVNRGYEEAADALAEAGAGAAAFVLLDLGLSSTQLASDRGFSMSGDQDAPLDMRFDPGSGPTAADLIRELPEPRLAAALHDLGEVPASRRLAARLKEASRAGRMRTVGQFTAACRSVLGSSVRKMPSPTLPAQAMRILVNREIDRLDAFLAAVPRLLAPSGRLAVISFHSIEDRQVKLAFRQLARQGGFAVETKRPLSPGPAEVAENRRARSARMRVLSRVAEEVIQ